MRWRACLHALVGGAAGSIVLWLGAPILATVIYCIAGALLAVAIVSPTGAYATVQRTLSRFGHLVGVAMTWILLAPLYYLIFTPFGLMFRRGARDRLQRRYDSAAASYWADRDEAGSTTSEHPY